MKDQTKSFGIPVCRQLALRGAAKTNPRLPARSGRPTKLTPSVQRQICKSIEAGNFMEVAAELSGVGRSTLFRWMALADGGDPQYQDFRDAVKAARARAEARAVAAIQRAGRRAWQANAWFLERSFPERWRRRDPREDAEHEHAGIAVQAGHTPDVADRLSDAMRRDPNQIPRMLAALEVLTDVLDGGSSDGPTAAIESPAPRLGLASGPGLPPHR